MHFLRPLSLQAILALAAASCFASSLAAQQSSPDQQQRPAQQNAAPQQNPAPGPKIVPPNANDAQPKALIFGSEAFPAGFQITAPSPKTCAIPLLAVAPQNDTTDKMPLVTPRDNPDPKMTTTTGAPPCETKVGDGASTSWVLPNTPALKLIIDPPPAPLVPLKK
jgi:hypothetical protein